MDDLINYHVVDCSKPVTNQFITKLCKKKKKNTFRIIIIIIIVKCGRYLMLLLL